MHIISKTIKGKEFVYSKSFMIACNSEEQAIALAKHLNEKDDQTVGIFKIQYGEVWHHYEIDKYDSVPAYKLVSFKNKISIKRFD